MRSIRLDIGQTIIRSAYSNMRIRVPVPAFIIAKQYGTCIRLSSTISIQNAQKRQSTHVNRHHRSYKTSSTNRPTQSVSGILNKHPVLRHAAVTKSCSFKPLHPNAIGVDLDNTDDLREQMRKAYDDALNFCRSKKLPDDVDPDAVFACNRLNLRGIDVYGFDYDYTLAHYKPQLEHLIYCLARDVLLKKFKVYIVNFALLSFMKSLLMSLVLSNKLQYPKEVANLEYNPQFAVRGLHYDIHKGLLLKVDSFMQVQMGCVYRGLSPLSDDEVLELYGSRKIPMQYVEPQPNLIGQKVE